MLLASLRAVPYAILKDYTDGSGGGSLGLIKFSEGSGAQRRLQAIPGTVLDRWLLLWFLGSLPTDQL